MELATVVVRDDGFDPPPASTDDDAGSRCHARWQRRHRLLAGGFAGFAIPW
jgi:hypothetical protein